MSLTNRKARAAVISELSERLSSLEANCLTDLEAGLGAMRDGDLTRSAVPVTTPVQSRSGDPDLDALVDICNAMLTRAQGALGSYNGVRETLRETLGDQSSLEQLRDRLGSLDGRCLTGLEAGLLAMAGGDLDQDVQPVTRPIEAVDGKPVGELAETFNRMLGRAQTAVRGYNDSRTQIAALVGDIATTAETVDGCLSDLQHALRAVKQGDLTVTLVARDPAANSAEPARMAELQAKLDGMSAAANAAVTDYNDLRGELGEALGDRSSLAELQTRLDSLADHCMADLVEGLAAMGEGDLRHEVVPVTHPVQRSPEEALGSLATTFNGMLARVQAAVAGYNASRGQVGDIVGRLATTATQLSAASQRMASTSEETGRAVSEIAHAVSDVAQGAERQARTVESTREATEQVVAATQESAANAQQTAEAAEAAQAVAQEGAAAVLRATAAMSSVRESSTSATAAIRQLGVKSEQIGSIVDTITGIAGQTNLLALNAAIEAARAGEQGRGFAVVAEQVRKLAEESQAAAASIAGLIDEIQGETSSVITVVERGASLTEDGVATVDQAREAFERIGTSVGDMHGRINEIAAAVQQIAASSSRVQEDMSEVAAVAEQSSASSQEVSASTEQTSASAQEIASSAGALAGTATELAELVGRFQLDTATAG